MEKEIFLAQLGLQFKSIAEQTEGTKSITYAPLVGIRQQLTNIMLTLFEKIYF